MTEQEARSVSGEGTKRRKLTYVLVAVAIVLLLVCVAAVVVLAFYLAGGQGLPDLPISLPGLAEDEVMLAFYSGRDEVELHLLGLGQEEDDEETLLVEADVRWAAVHLGLAEDERYQGSIGGDFGCFVPGSDRLLFWYALDDENVIQEIRVGDDEAIELIDSDERFLWGTLFGDSGVVFLQESGTGSTRCYVARPGGEAERVAKADRCWVSWDGSTIIFSDKEDDAVTLVAADIDGENEKVLLEEVEGVASHRVSSDGLHVAYVQREDGEVQLHLVERSSGEEDEVSDEVIDVLSYDFVPGGDTLFYVAVEESDDENVLRLYTSDSDDPIAEGPMLKAGFTPEGRSLIYLLGDEDGEETLYVRSMDSGEEVELLEGEYIGYAILKTSPLRVMGLSIGEDDFELKSADTAGGDVVDLLSEDDVSFEARYAPNGSLLYVSLRGDDGTSLFVTPVDEAGGSILVEEWASIRLLNLSPDGSQLAFSGYEDSGDDPALYVVSTEGEADPVELDDDLEKGRFFAGVRNAVFSADGESVIYTAITGDDSDDVEVRRVRVDGEEDYEVLYEEAILAAARWDNVAPSYVRLRWRTAAGETAEVVVGEPPEPTPPPAEGPLPTEAPEPTEEPVEIVTVTPAPEPTEAPATEEPEKVTLSWFIGLGAGGDPDQMEATEEVVGEFNASQELIELVPEFVEYGQALDLLKIRIASGDAPDIVGPFSMARGHEFADHWLDIDDYPAAALESSWVDYDVLFGLPVTVYPSFIYYNRELFDEAGVEYPPHEYGAPYADGDEWTVEKLEEISMLLTLDADGNNATSADFDPENIVQFGFVPQWLALRGEAALFGAGSLVDAAGDATMPDHWREALRWYYDGMWDKRFIPNGPYLDDLGFNGFNSGKVAMAYTHLWYTCCVEEVPEWDIAALPSYDGETTAELHVDMIGVLEDTEYPEEAVEVVQYLVANEDLIDTWGGGMPAFESMWGDYFEGLDQEFPQGVDWQVVIDSLEYPDLYYEEGLPNMSAANDRLWDFKSMYENTPDLALEAAIDELLADLQAIFEEAD